MVSRISLAKWGRNTGGLQCGYTLVELVTALAVVAVVAAVGYP